MPTVNFPLSGAVTQTINPWTAMFNAIGNQFSLVTVNLGRSSAPHVEHEILEQVGSYGKQLGRIGDALAVLLAHFKPDRPLSAAEQKTLADLRMMLDEIAVIKSHHGRQVAAPQSLALVSESP